ncbi:hypothetical protein [Mucilaginibacter dorajii]|uniref:DoxX family protein n=1 Tax=Mucilaginibacter dorajii TaxID=692994 RepID=A0ABP7PZF5_9SPHI|nr:hypothetical protein [Mucilaginibacter dorajii]MCS3732989.1 hypothetical protein [Mucilaginibacter dorajii]
MTGFKVFILLFFLFCGYAANNGGGSFAFIEFLAITNIDDYETSERLVLLLTIVAQVAGVFALVTSNNRLMLASVIALSAVVIMVTIASAGALGKVIVVNTCFLLAAIVYVVLHFRKKPHPNPPR